MMDDVEKFSDLSDDDSKEKEHTRENNRAAIQAAEMQATEIQAAMIRAEIKAAECIVSPKDNHVEAKVFRKRRNINETFVGGLLRRVSF